jgi:predicted RNA-binding protein (virulence factor B family)
MAISEASETAEYRVTAPEITVKTAGLAGIVQGRGGFVSVGLYRNALIPEDASPEHSLRTRGSVQPVAAE